MQKNPNLIIIDCEKKGNVVRFYLGNKNCTDYWGDDWNDRPYDCNAGAVYDQFILNTQDIAFPFGCKVLEPCDGVLNCSYSKEDMKKRRVPCLVIVPEKIVKDGGYWKDSFYDWVGSDEVLKIFFGDQLSVLEEKLEIMKPVAECVIKLADDTENRSF